MSDTDSTHPSSPIADVDAYVADRLAGKDGLQAPAETPPADQAQDEDTVADNEQLAAEEADIEVDDDQDDGVTPPQVPPGETADQAQARRKRRPSPAVRIGIAIGKQKAAEAEAARVKQELEELRKRITEAPESTRETTAAAPPQFTEAKPKLDDFLTEEDPEEAHEEAVYAWRKRRDAFNAKVEADARAAEESRVSSEAVAAAETAIKGHLARIDSYEAEHPGFKARFDTLSKTTPMTRAMGIALIEHAAGVVISDYLVQNQDVAADIAALPTPEAQHAAVAALKKVAEKFVAAQATTNTTRTETASPARSAASTKPSTHVPISPVGTASAAVSTTTDPEHEDPDEYIARRNRELDAREGRR